VRGVSVTALAGDYLDALTALPDHHGTRLFLFLGSTIGNFEREEAVAFLARVAQTMRWQDRLLVGVDLKKPREIVEPAYNDAQGITEQFNKNILVRINRELCGRFDLSSFQHYAPWVEAHSRIEMRLVSKVDQDVQIEGLERSFHFQKGESIHTENSHKWSTGQFEELCAQSGLRVRRTWLDEHCWFALNLLERV
jgi:L-histidine Nalpha-methyltransferase